MSDALAFMPPDGQSEYAFPPNQGDQDEGAQAARQQIQQSFDSQRMQRGMAQNLSKALSNQAAQIAQLRQRQAQQKT